MADEPNQETGEQASPPKQSGMSRRITLVIVIAVLILAGGYIVNRYWIEPVTAHQASSRSGPAAANQAASPDYPTAPAFTLSDIFGRPLSLDQYRGKVVLLDFWATWCGPCRSEIPGFIQLQKTYASQGFQIIGISEDQGGAGPVLDFYKQEGLDYRVALDNGKVGQLYGGVIGIPTTYLIGRDGRIYSKVPGAVAADYFEPAIKTLLASSPGEEVKNFRPLDGSENAQVETPAEANSPVPGIDVTKLSKAELTRYEEELSKQQCTCGCQMNVLECRKTDPNCETSRQLARDVLNKMDKAKHTI
jgi:thiol-disulfide isomerase/thioredoxin